jgi:hypothetical protein
MKIIKRTLMQMHQRSRDRTTDLEPKIVQYKGWLCIEAMKIEPPTGNMRTIRQIMKSVEKTYVPSNEYLILKAEFLVRIREWKEAILAINGTGKNTEVMQLEWIERISAVQEKINENDQKERRNRLISYSNDLSKNLFEKDEEIIKATKLMLNREYQEAIDEACKIWTKIMTISKPEMIYPKIRVLQIMIESTLSITMSELTYAEEWLETLKRIDYNGIMTAILDIKMMMRKAEEEEIICTRYTGALKRIEIIDDAIQRKDWLEQMRDLKTFYFELYEKIITIEIPEIEIPTPMNIRQTMFSHEDKPENVEVIREEQDASKLHQKLKERMKEVQIEEKDKVRQEKQQEEKGKKQRKRGQTKNKKIRKEVKKIETSSDEFENLSETETEKENTEPDFNLKGESKEMLRASWKNKMETYEEKTMPRILGRHFKKIREGLNMVMNRVAAIFRMINDTNEEDEEYIKEAYTYGSFLLTKHIQEKIGKKLPKGNIFRKIPKKKSFTIGEKLEGKHVEEELKETKYRADRATNVMKDLRANCEYLQEIMREEIHDEWENKQVQDLRRENSNTKKRVRTQLTNMILAQIHNLEQYSKTIIIPRNENELIKFIQGRDFEETIEE